jgi:carboxyl-terminal processing protease
MGAQSFGKGSVQTVYPLEAGNGLRLTTALYYTPGGRSIQEVGITPDIIVRAPEREPVAEGEEGESPRRVREKDLEHHFTQEDAAPQESIELGPGTTAAEGYGDDVQLGRAVELLKSRNYFEKLDRGRSEASLQAKAPEGAAGEVH